jgi:hypothetical protein
MIKKQKGLCAWCGVKMTLIENDGARIHSTATLDHHPLRKRDGGRLIHGNVVAACHYCNAARENTGGLVHRILDEMTA